MEPKKPKLKQASKVKQIYPLNCFPSEFATRLAEYVCSHLAVRSDADLEGKDWERIFAGCIGATWKPSNIGLDDISSSKYSIAWGAKTVKKSKIITTAEAVLLDKPETIRLISGRNSTVFSYDEPVNPKESDPNKIGKLVLEIWNQRVKEVLNKYEDLRTVVLVKGDGLLTLAVFEYQTVLYALNDYSWKWNKKNNLEGFNLNGGHKFTWQPHGSQFTVIEEIPPNALRLRIKMPDQIQMSEVLKQIQFDQSFYMKM